MVFSLTRGFVSTRLYGFICACAVNTTTECTRLEPRRVAPKDNRKRVANFTTTENRVELARHMNEGPSSVQRLVSSSCTLDAARSSRGPSPERRGNAKPGNKIRLKISPCVGLNLV